MSGRVLLAGASGELGSQIADRLLERGVSLRAMSRRADSLAKLGAAGAEVVEADLMDPDSLDAVMDVRQVVTTANSFMGRGPTSPERIDALGNRHLIDAARRAGIEHFLFVSAKVPDAFRRIDYFRIKAETEAYLRASGLKYTILRPTAFLDTWGRIVGDSIRDKGEAPVFGAGQDKANYIAVEDVAKIVSLLVATVPDENRIIEIGGPDNITSRELVSILAEVLKREPKIKTVPLPMLWLISRAAGLFNSATGRQMKTAYASATAPEIFDFDQVRDQFPIDWTDARGWARKTYAAD